MISLFFFFFVIHSCIIFYLIIFQVVNDLLNPAGQNLRIREDTQVLVNHLL